MPMLYSSLKTARYFVIGVILTCFQACSAPKEAQESRRTGMGAASDATQAGESATGVDDSILNTDPSSLGQLGLADICQFKKEGDQGTFTCTPRELPIVKSISIPTDFDPSKACQFDLDKMQCDLGKDKTAFIFDFDERSKAEQVYEKIPLIIFAAKAMLGSQLDKRPAAEKEAILGALDMLDKYKLALFTGADLAPMSDEAVVLAKKVKPSLSDEDADKIKTQLKTALDAANAKRSKDGNLELNDILSLSSSILASLPADIVGDTAGSLGLDQLVSFLKASSGDSSGDLSQLLSIFIPQ